MLVERAIRRLAVCFRLGFIDFRFEVVSSLECTVPFVSRPAFVAALKDAHFRNLNDVQS